MIDRAGLRLLHTPQGQQALFETQALAPREVDYLLHWQRLAKIYGESLAHAALEQAILRQHAAAKFSRYAEMFFARQALEQATPEPIARHRARRFIGAPRVLDLGCGLGSDSLALAEHSPVVAVDRDELRLALLQANARALALNQRIDLVAADLGAPAWRTFAGMLAFADPARRSAERRLRGVERYRPPLSSLIRLGSGLAGMGIKISPAVDLAQIDGLDCEIEFISLGGELKEAALWLGALKDGRRRATLLPGGYSLSAEAEPDIPIRSLGAYLYEPDPALMRAGLVRLLGARIDAAQIDPKLAFLTSDHPVDTPFARTFRVLDVLPFSLKRLRQFLRQRGVGQLTLKKRGSAVDLPSLERRLKLHGPEEATVVLTRVQGKPLAILVEALLNFE